MLRQGYCSPPAPMDALIFEKLVPADHYLRKVKAVVDFSRFLAEVAVCYSPDVGRPAGDPVLMMKLELLQYHYGLSDARVIQETQVNVAFRFFLDLGLDCAPPHPSSLTVFRKRLGSIGHGRLFHALLSQGRDHGLISDDLRLKDSTHMLANIAYPYGVRIVAQMRDKLLVALAPLDSERVADERAEAERIRQGTRALAVDQRLRHRIEHLRRLAELAQAHITVWADHPDAEPSDRQQEGLQRATGLARKVLYDYDNPRKGDKLISADDPDARRGMHGQYFNGYLLDITADPESQMVTAVDALPGNADEAANGTALIDQEQQAHGNRIAALSIDRIGFRGDLLRTWTDPEGMRLSVYVPPKPDQRPSAVFGPNDFEHDGVAGTLNCPAHHQTSSRSRSTRETGWQYRFSAGHCRDCPFRERCLTKPASSKGRTIIINDYEAEYAAARQKTGTPEYGQVRRLHARVERKLCEMAYHRDARHARYRGRDKVRIQAFLSGWVINIWRMVQLLTSVPSADRSAAMPALAC